MRGRLLTITMVARLSRFRPRKTPAATSPTSSVLPRSRATTPLTAPGNVRSRSSAFPRTRSTSPPISGMRRSRSASPLTTFARIDFRPSLRSRTRARSSSRYRSRAIAFSSLASVTRRSVTARRIRSFLLSPFVSHCRISRYRFPAYRSWLFAASLIGFLLRSLSLIFILTFILSLSSSTMIRWFRRSRASFWIFVLVLVVGAAATTAGGFRAGCVVWLAFGGNRMLGRRGWLCWCNLSDFTIYLLSSRRMRSVTNARTTLWRCFPFIIYRFFLIN